MTKHHRFLITLFAGLLLLGGISCSTPQKAEVDLDSFFSGGTTSFLENDVAGLDDFELVCFLVVRPRA